MRLKKAIAKIVELERVCRVATAAQSGVPHVVPVCHVLVGGNICFASSGSARKVRNLRANPHATVTIDLYSEAWSNLKGVMVQGTAELVEKGPRFQELRDELYAKYPQYKGEAGLGRGDVIVEITPKHVFSWGLE
jgi:nitroimidazol reductase NimA-like FMN-containing flavoprotein (pyridoxamine 5'-phosphate oxidase superfamily)